VGPSGLGVRGREGEGAPGYVRWKGKVQLKCGDGRILPF
jgi:hypothetical protein